MAQVLSLVNGVPRAITVNAGAGEIEVRDEGTLVLTGATCLNFKGLTVTATDAGGGKVDIAIKSSLIYDRTLTIGAGGVTAGTPITLPASGSYIGDDLSVMLAGQFLEPGVDYNYVGTGNKTQITLVEDIAEGEVLRFRIEDSVTSIYDETFTVTGSTLVAGTPITLPSGGTYDDVDLKVYINGQFVEPDGIDYNYVGAGPSRTQITLVEDAPVGADIRFRIEESSVTIYDETIAVGPGGVTTGTDITLPNNGSFVGQELEVYLNGEMMESGIDWTFSGANVITKIQMTFDLVEGDRLRFRIDSLDTQ